MLDSGIPICYNDGVRGCQKRPKPWFNPIFHGITEHKCLLLMAVGTDHIAADIPRPS